MADETVAPDTETEDGNQNTGELTVEQYRAQLAESQKRIKELNRESAERRKKLEAFEKAQAEKETADLSELEKAKRELDGLKPELEQLKAERRKLLLERQFEKAARELKLEFASERAQETAYKLLDTEALGEDMSGMVDAVKALQKEHAYLFGKTVQPAPETDATQKGKGRPGEMTDAEKAAIAARYRIPYQPNPTN